MMVSMKKLHNVGRHLNKILNQNCFLITEFLLGESILIAPVVNPNQFFRDIYLPLGSWLDGNTKETHEGPVWLRNYPVPLEMLPYFTIIAAKDLEGIKIKH